MKKLLLTSLISAALLTACGDKPEKKATEKAAAKAEAAAQVAEKTSAPALSPEDQAEASFKAYAAAMQKYYDATFVGSSLFESVKYTVVSYEKGKDSSTATSRLQITFKQPIEGKKDFSIDANSKIAHDAATLDQGLIAKIDSKLVKESAKDGETANPLADKLMDSLDSVALIKSDNSATETISLKPVTLDLDAGNQLEANDGKLAINGATLTIDSDLNTIEKGALGRFAFDFKGLTGDANFKVEPTGITGEHLDNGDFNIKTTAPIQLGDDKNTVKIDAITGKGNAKFNEKFKVMLGDFDYQVGKIVVAGPQMPVPFSIDSIGITGKINMDDKENLSESAVLKIVPTEGVTAKLTEGRFDVSELTLAFDIKDFPASVLKDYEAVIDGYGQQSGDVEANKKAEAKAKALFDSIKAQGTQFDVKLDLATAAGSADLDAKIKVKSDSEVTFEALSKSPNALAQLLDVDISASVPAALLEPTGMQMMTAPFLKKEKDSDVYQSKIVTKDGQLLINGMPFPM